MNIMDGAWEKGQQQKMTSTQGKQKFFQIQQPLFKLKIIILYFSSVLKFVFYIIFY